MSNFAREGSRPSSRRAAIHWPAFSRRWPPAASRALDALERRLEPYASLPAEAATTPAALATALVDTYNIYTVAIDTGPVKGARVTPHVYTTTAELDVLVKALAELTRA